MKDDLEQLLELHRQSMKAARRIADNWSADERYRNDPLRQKLTTELMETLPKPTRLGKVIDDIARRMRIDLA